MKEIIIYVSGLGESGGKERVVSNLLLKWADRYNITLITKNKSASYYKLPDNINQISIGVPLNKYAYNLKLNKLIRISALFINSLYSVIKMKKILKKIKYDYIYVTTPLESFEMYHTLKEPEKKLVVSEHASINAYNSMFSAMKRKAYPNAYCISVPNKMDTEEYKKWGCNAVYIPHLLTFLPDESDLPKSKTVINVGRLTADKQQDVLIKIWSKIKNKNGWTLQIIGHGENYDKLSAMIAEYGLNDSVKLLGTRKDIEEIYKNASLFAFTSRTEGFGMVLLEAMSFGVPCISFDCPSGPRDVISDGENGYLIENGNIELFTSKLQDMLLMPESELCKLSKGALETVKNWSDDKILDMWSEVYK